MTPKRSEGRYYKEDRILNLNGVAMSHNLAKVSYHIFVIALAHHACINLQWCGQEGAKGGTGPPDSLDRYYLHGPL